MLTEERVNPVAAARRGAPLFLAAAVATTGIVCAPTMGAWSGTLPDLYGFEVKPEIQQAIASDAVSVPISFESNVRTLNLRWPSGGDDGGAATGSGVRVENSVANLRLLSGLTASQLGRLFGVSRRSIQGWVAGGSMSPVHHERLSLLLARITPLGVTAEDRKAALLRSSEGPSLFHQYIDEIQRGAVLQVRPFSIAEQLRD